MRSWHSGCIGFIAFPILMWAIALAHPEYASRRTWKEKRR